MVLTFHLSVAIQLLWSVRAMRADGRTGSQAMYTIFLVYNFVQVFDFVQFFIFFTLTMPIFYLTSYPYGLKRRRETSVDEQGVARVVRKKARLEMRLGSVIRWSTTTSMRSPIASRLGMEMLWFLWEPGTGFAPMI